MRENSKIYPRKRQFSENFIYTIDLHECYYMGLNKYLQFF